jgi:hypothetical protein
MAVKKRKTLEKHQFSDGISRFQVNWVSIVFVVLLAISSFWFPKYVDYKTRQQLQLSKATKPKYWSYFKATWNPNGNLRTMNRVFERLDYEFVNGSKGDDWDVLWSLE